MLPLLKVTCISFLLLSSFCFGENWPSWRGPRGDGVTQETNLPLTWSATENMKWKVALPEPGNSTPIVFGDRIFLTQSVGQRRTLMCFARNDGKVLWQAGPEWKQNERTHKTNPYCSASAVTDGERVIAWFGSAGLWCWDLQGKELWSVDLGKQDHEWGYGSSPIIHGDLCILNFGPGERSFLVAVDKRTGKEVWRTDVPPPAKWEGSGSQQRWSGSWSTPMIMDTGSRTDLVVALPGAVRGFDPRSGKEIWNSSGLNPLAYADPLIVDGVIVAMGGFGGSSVGVKAGGEGDLTSTDRLWQEKRSAQRIGSGVVKDGLIYMINEPGVVQCIEPKTGEITWQERLRVPSGRASSWSSFVLSGDRLYIGTQNSDTVVLKAGPKFEQLAVNSLGDGMSNSSIAVSDGELFIRTHKHLWCIGGKSDRNAD